MSFVFDPSQPAGKRISDVTIAGAPIKADKIYGVVSNNYLRNGGDGYGVFAEAESFDDFGPDIAEVTAEYLSQQGQYNPYTDGRIQMK